MSGNDAAGAGDDQDVSVADERALRRMFAALVQDAEPSELSPLAIQRQARSEQGSTADRRARRLRYTRNVLIAAVFAAVVAVVLPHLGGSGSTTAASGSSSSSSAASAAASSGGAEVSGAAAGSYSGMAAGAGAASTSAAARAPAANSAAASGAASSAPAAGGDAAAGGAPAGSSAAGSAASSGAMSSGAMSSSAAAAPAAPSAGATSSDASSAGGASSAAASSAAAAGSASRGPCLSVPARALADVRAAMPGYGGAIRIASCALQDSIGPATGRATFTVLRSGPASCGVSVTACPAPPGAGARIGGTTDAYAHPGGVLVTGRRGLVVTVTSTAGGPDREALIAGARALLKTVS